MPKKEKRTHHAYARGEHVTYRQKYPAQVVRVYGDAGPEPYYDVLYLQYGNVRVTQTVGSYLQRRDAPPTAK